MGFPEVTVMSQTHTIELPDEIFSALKKAAEDRGLSPIDWIASQLPWGAVGRTERPLSEALEGILGAFDSTASSDHSHPATPFSDLIAEKFRKQGLRIP
jgi:hypothetical protein